MATAESVKGKIQGLIDSANAATGNTDADLSTAVGSLIAGFGQGGGDYTNDIVAALINKSITEFVIPNGTTAIGAYAFARCSELMKLIIPNDVTSIGDYAFMGSKLKFDSIPDSIETVGIEALTDRLAANFKRLPENMITIGRSAFSYNSAITSIVIPQKVKTINSIAFRGCTGLATVTFEGTPTSISSDVFNNCPGLTAINCPWSEGQVANAPWGATNATINYNHAEG